MKLLKQNKCALFMVAIAFLIGPLVYSNFAPKEFEGCDSLPLKARDKVDSKIFNLMKNNKFQEVITLGGKHLKDDSVWYCDPYFWNQRARAFYNLGDCVQSQIASLHAIYVTPEEANKSQKEFYDFVRNSDICVSKTISI